MLQNYTDARLGISRNRDLVHEKRQVKGRGSPMKDYFGYMQLKT
jgi:hypothetical protein